jgi:hypothetical protein
MYVCVYACIHDQLSLRSALRKVVDGHVCVPWALTCVCVCERERGPIQTCHPRNLQDHAHTHSITCIHQHIDTRTHMSDSTGSNPTNTKCMIMHTYREREREREIHTRASGASLSVSTVHTFTCV